MKKFFAIVTILLQIRFIGDTTPVTVTVKDSKTTQSAVVTKEKNFFVEPGKVEIKYENKTLIKYITQDSLLEILRTGNITF